MNIWEWIYRIAWGILIVLCLAGVVCAFLPEVRRLTELQEKRAALQEETNRIEAHVKDLQTRQARFASDPLFVERTAREAGMSRSNETVFKVIHDRGPSDAATKTP